MKYSLCAGAPTTRVLSRASSHTRRKVVWERVNFSRICEEKAPCGRGSVKCRHSKTRRRMTEADVCALGVLAQLNQTQPASPTLDSGGSEWLQGLRASQGLSSGGPISWPANVSFLQALTEVLGARCSNATCTRGATRGGQQSSHLFAVEIGAGDGKRFDGYHRPLDPVWPLRVGLVACSRIQWALQPRAHCHA